MKSTFFQSPRISLRWVKIQASQITRASFTTSEGWALNVPTRIQLVLKPLPQPSGVNTSSCSPIPTKTAIGAQRFQNLIGVRAAMSMTGTPTSA